MAQSSPKLNDLLEITWSVLLLVCFGLALGHIVSAAWTQSLNNQDVIENTFTTDRQDGSL